HHRDLPPFPTRRSSDLRKARYRRITGALHMYLKSMHTSETVERAGGPQAAVTGSWHGRQWRDFKRYSAAQRLSRIGLRRWNLMRSEEHTSELQSRENLV